MTWRLHFPDYTPVTVERLKGLSIEALYALAEKMALDLPPDLEPMFVIEALLEAFEEDTEERKASGDAAVHIEEKKYSGSELDEIDASLDAAPCIENRYNETVIHVVVKDPEWAFVFWDVKDEELAALEAGDGLTCLFLRVIQDPLPDGKCNASFDVVVGDEDDHWYLYLPDEGRQYRVDLYARLGSKPRLLAHSALVGTPRSIVAAPFGRLDKKAGELAALSGLDSLKIVQNAGRHPSRILEDDSE